jgi:uncharacterized membrane protein YgaE (UPF0421/DUF939 family)
MNEVTTVMNNWSTYPIVWVGLGFAVFLILLMALLLAKLNSISRSTKQSYRELGNKIDSLYRTSDAFNELNAKIDNLNKTTNELKRPTTEYIPTS